jgi:O-antigen/teichoic acid export membrane protein
MTADTSAQPLARVRRHVVVYTVGMFLSRAVAFVMLPVYTRYLTPGDYGALQLIVVTFEVVSIVAGSRLGAGVFHFYHKSDDSRHRRQVLSTALILMVATYTLASVLTFLAAAPLSRLVFGPQNDPDLIRIGAAILGLESLLIVPMAYIQVRERSGLFVAINTGKLALQLSLNILFVVVMQLGVKGPLYSTLISSALVGSLVTVMLVRDVGLSFSGSAARDLLRFGVPFVGSQIGTFISTYGDRYFLARVSNVGAVGIYGLAYQFGFLLHIVGLAPFQSVWDPMRFEIAKRSDRDELYARGFVYFNVIYLTTAVGIALYVHDFIRIMSAPSFHSAADIVPVILLAYVFQGWTEQQQLGLMISEKTERITWANWVAAGVALLGYALLIPPLHGLGAALATVAAFGARQWMVYVMSQRLWPIKYRWAPVVRLLLLATLVVVLAVLLPPFDLGTSLAARTALLGLYGLGIWFGRILTDADRQYVRGMALRWMPR